MTQLANHKGKKTVSLIVPVYNNEESLPYLFQRVTLLEPKLMHKNIELEYIFVDDGSSDRSFLTLNQFKSVSGKIKILKLSQNFGAVNALRAGAKFVTGDAFIIMAADLQDPPELILTMCENWLAGNKFVICERISRQDSISSQIFSKFHYFFLRKIVFNNYPKKGFDLALMDRSLLDIINSSFKNGSVPMIAFSLGYKPKVLQYAREKRVHGVSGWTFAKKINYFMDLIFGYSNKPLRFISTIGFVVSFISFTYGIVVLAGALAEGVKVPGFTTIALLICFLAGVQLLMLGILGEYIWRVYEQVNNRPAAVIESFVEK